MGMISREVMRLLLQERMLRSNELHDSFLKIHQEHIIEVASMQKYREAMRSRRSAFYGATHTSWLLSLLPYALEIFTKRHKFILVSLECLLI